MNNRRYDYDPPSKVYQTYPHDELGIARDRSARQQWIDEDNRRQ